VYFLKFWNRYSKNRRDQHSRRSLFEAFTSPKIRDRMQALQRPTLWISKC